MGMCKPDCVECKRYKAIMRTGLALGYGAIIALVVFSLYVGVFR